MTKNKVTIYVRGNCPFCVRAQDLCKQLGVVFEVVDMTNNELLQADVFARSQGMRTVPQIFVGDKHVGGFTDLVALHEAGNFLPLCIMHV